MTVYVDPIFECCKNKNWQWEQACHLIADTDDELHLFASSIGLKRAWFQDQPDSPHYDLTPNKRKMAIKKGAIELDRREFIKTLREIREGHQGVNHE